MPQLKEYTSEKALQGLNEQPLTAGIEHMTTSARFVIAGASAESRAIHQLGEVGQHVYDDVKMYNDSQAELGFTNDLMNLEINQQQTQSDFFKTPDAMDPAKLDQFRAQQHQQVQDMLGKYSGYDPRLQERFTRDVGEYQLRNYHQQVTELSEVAAAHTVGALDGLDRKAAKLSAVGAKSGDLTQLDSALEYQQRAYEAAKKNPALSPVSAAMIDEHLAAKQRNTVIAAAETYIQNSPQLNKDAAQSEIEKLFGPNSKYYEILGPEGYNALRHGAMAEASWRSTTGNSQIEAQAREAHDYVQQGMSKILNSLYDDKGNMRLPPDAWKQARALWDDPKGTYRDKAGKLLHASTREDVEALTNALQKAAKGEEGQTDKATFFRLENDYSNNNLTMKDLMANSKNLKVEDMKYFINKLQNRNNPAEKMLDQGWTSLFRMAQNSIAPPGANDIKQQEFYNWQNDARQRLDLARRDPKMTPEMIYDKYLNARSPDYLGSRDILHRYGASAAPPPLPGTLIPQEQPGWVGRNLYGEGPVPPKVVTEAPMPGLEGIKKPPNMSDQGFAAQRFIFGGR